MRTLIILFIMLLFSIVSTAAQDSATINDEVQVLNHENVERTYVLHFPADFDGETPLPLVIALHQTGSSAKAMAAITGLNAAADHYGFIVAYPNSYDHAFNDGRTEAGVAQQTVSVDDVDFITTLTDHLIATYAVDSENVILVGHVTGGLTALRIACERPEQFRGIAVVAGRLWGYQRDACTSEPTHPLDVLFINGTVEPTILVEPPTPLEILSQEESVEFWAERQGCDAQNAASTANSTANASLMIDCAEGRRVAAYTAHNVESRDWPRIGESFHVNQYGVDATEILAHFFFDADEAAWQIPQPELDADSSEPRSYSVYVPNSYHADEPIPLVYVLHGRPSNGISMIYITEMNRVAAQEGFIVVYPNGIGQEWNYTRGVPGYATSRIDDARFLSDLIDDLSVNLNIDHTRLYVTGFSNGGFMTHRLACETRGRYAAFAPVGATVFSGQPEYCEGREVEPVPIMMIHGTEDVSVPWDGRQIVVNSMQGPQQIYSTYPMQFSVNFWGTINKCDSEKSPELEVLPQGGDSPDTVVRFVTFTDCAPKSALQLYLITGGGHNWPGVPGVISEEIAGKVNMDIFASQVIWDFFKQHRLE